MHPEIETRMSKLGRLVDYEAYDVAALFQKRERRQRPSYVTRSVRSRQSDTCQLSDGIARDVKPFPFEIPPLVPHEEALSMHSLV